MGNCESMQNRTKKISKILSFKDSNRNSKYSSSSSPNLSSTHMPKDDSLLINAKKYNSVRKLNIYENNQYILPMELAKREDITKKYIISKTVLGDGATSLVYLAENSSKQKFAIKRINKEKKTVNQKVLLKEAEIQGQTDLFEFLLKSPLGYFPDEIAVDFLIQIFSAIDYLHSINIVHCDIKPENFVLKINKTKTELKLVDFGNIRRKPKDKERLNNFSGTREYMAPEALENYGFNEKVDEWAAGVIMYNMLTGADPFSSDNDSDYKDNIRFKEIKFEYIKNEKLRNLNKKLLNRFINNRITAKEAIDELINIKNEMIFNKDNNLDVFKNLNKFDIIDNKTAIKNYS